MTEDTEKRLDRTRAEGVYASIEIYPPPPLVGGARLVKIERVNGDCTVSEMTITPDEAISLLDQLVTMDLEEELR